MSALIPKVYPLLSEALEVGVARGYRRAFKHTDIPPEEHIISAIVDAAMTEIFERFDISDEKYVDRVRDSG